MGSAVLCVLGPVPCSVSLFSAVFVAVGLVLSWIFCWSQIWSGAYSGRQAMNAVKPFIIEYILLRIPSHTPGPAACRLCVLHAVSWGLVMLLWSTLQSSELILQNHTEHCASCESPHLTPGTWARLYLLTGRVSCSRGSIGTTYVPGFPWNFTFCGLILFFTSLTQCCIESLEIRLQMCQNYHNVTWRKAVLLGILRPAAFPLERLQMDYSQKEAGTSYICFGIGILLIICPS